VGRSRYCGYNIGIAEMMFERRYRGDSMSRFGDEVLLGERARVSLGKGRVWSWVLKP
jgi:hypothetical protein